MIHNGGVFFPTKAEQKETQKRLEALIKEHGLHKTADLLAKVTNQKAKKINKLLKELEKFKATSDYKNYNKCLAEIKKEMGD